MKITSRLGWLKIIQQCFIGLAILLILGAYGPMIQAEPEYHLVGRATAGIVSNYQLVEVGQIVGSINAKVEISFAEVFLDVGTGSVRGTIRHALKFVAGPCGLTLEDVTFALTGLSARRRNNF